LKIRNVGSLDVTETEISKRPPEKCVY